MPGAPADAAGTWRSPPPSPPRPAASNPAPGRHWSFLRPLRRLLQPQPGRAARNCRRSLLDWRSGLDGRLDDDRRRALGRSLRNMLLDQLAHTGVARAIRGAAHDDRDDVPFVTPHRGGQVVAGGVGVAGLDAVDAFDISEQVVVVADLGPAVLKGRRREISIIEREPVLNGAAQDGLVARRGDLVVGRQARGVDVGGAGHAQHSRFQGHELGEFFLRSADRLGDHRGGVVRRLGDQRLDRVLDLDGLIGLEAELHGTLTGGVCGDLERGIELELAGLELLEQQIKRHDLGERGRVARLIGLDCVEHFAGLVVDHDVGVVRPAGLRLDGTRPRRRLRLLTGARLRLPASSKHREGRQQADDGKPTRRPDKPQAHGLSLPVAARPVTLVAMPPRWLSSASHTSQKSRGLPGMGTRPFLKLS